jgi:hypothetical protein
MAQACAGSLALDHLEHGQAIGDIINDGIVEACGGPIVVVTVAVCAVSIGNPRTFS